MKFFRYTLFLIFFPSSIYSQSAIRQFKKLSNPEKCWVMCHIFKAKKAMHITKAVQLYIDSVKQSKLIGTDNNGGQLDAFKHAYWMASLSIEIGSRKSLKLGKAHEKGNYLQYKKQALEDSILPDSISSSMDLKNNETGISLVQNSKHLSISDVQKKIFDALYQGKLYIIKKDAQGNFLTCDGKQINLNDWRGKWAIPKCIISSNTKPLTRC